MNIEKLKFYVDNWYEYIEKAFLERIDLKPYDSLKFDLIYAHDEILVDKLKKKGNIFIKYY